METARDAMTFSSMLETVGNKSRHVMEGETGQQEDSDDREGH